jgi:2-polyprenyl-6-methoxyphenol hydroxylase-like FAD-dependent oxidoreductase
VPLILGDTVHSLQDDGQQVRVAYESGKTAQFDLVVGADGLHSRVRRLVFGPDDQFENYLGMVVAAFEANRYPKRDELVAMMHAEVGFQVIRLSLRDERTLFLFTVRHEGAVPTDRAGQEELLRSRLGAGGWEVPAMLDVMTQAQDLYFDSVSQIRMPSWTKGRVALVGDAAAGPSFLAGQGSALAMVEAYTLAAELSRTDDYAGAFVRYNERLAPLLVSKQDAAKGLGLAFAPKNRTQLVVRNAVMKLMALPKVADLAMGKSFYDAVELPAFAESEPGR